MKAQKKIVSAIIAAASIATAIAAQADTLSHYQFVNQEASCTVGSIENINMDATGSKLTLIPGQSLEIISTLYDGKSILNYQGNNSYKLELHIAPPAYGSGLITSQLSSETPKNIDIFENADITVRMRDGTESKNICELTAHYSKVD